MKSQITNRIDSIDITRGFIVFSSVFLLNLPGNYSGINVHVDWYGFSILDIIFPAFITIFGTSMAIAYRKGVHKKRFVKRTIKLILFGLLYNIIVSWSLDLDTLRFTGVLQLFAVLGVATVIITKFVKKPIILILISLLIFTIQGLFLVQAGDRCGEIFPGPECSPSSSIDPHIFGEDHMYRQGERGYDPEGVPGMFGALGNVLLGFAAGQLILGRKRVEWKLFLYTVSLFTLFIIALFLVPIGKRMWTPSFGLLSSSITIFILTGFYMLFDRKDIQVRNGKKAVRWFFVAFGLNSFLIYFGKDLLNSILANVRLTLDGADQPLKTILMNFLELYTSWSDVIYSILILGIWITVALVCHKWKWYLKV